MSIMFQIHCLTKRSDLDGDVDEAAELIGMISAASPKKNTQRQRETKNDLTKCQKKVLKIQQTCELLDVIKKFLTMDVSMSL